MRPHVSKGGICADTWCATGAGLQPSFSADELPGPANTDPAQLSKYLTYLLLLGNLPTYHSTLAVVY
jgi:hypothetical protein